jgi:hypothetical protein
MGQDAVYLALTFHTTESSLSVSRDKQAIRDLARQGQHVAKPKDLLKDRSKQQDLTSCLNDKRAKAKRGHCRTHSLGRLSKPGRGGFITQHFCGSRSGP